mmetsp:Transcript_11468/g.18667  ORF Transcript_11468/g.18667 Transcript_11468/m.18667 type:complete len:240 (+) Transcript_11468:1227-1946(+)
MSVSSLNKKPPVLVVLLGWWKSRPTHVQKYSSMFLSKPNVCGVVQDTMSTPELVLPMLRNQAARRVKGKVSTFVQDFIKETGQTPKIVIQAMSNNGTIEYLAFSKLLSEENNTLIKENVRGVILDSAPGVLDLKSWCVAGIESKPDAPVVAASSIAAIGALYSMYTLSGSTSHFASNLLLGGIAAFSTAHAMNFAYHRALLANDLNSPMLFLYSKEDTLVSYKSVENTMLLRKEQGIHM